ncbi:hypothetical protein EW146_g8711 [Bondarzewia mesenterica]|uniref:Endoplasmic reticulum junction formation protein lunapark n=1 Tax=Bondarzewia mesenterica TaxID=1095465 RepID=A0A4S4LC68_9AGAM|nr:hypothetical protein EW146_g8711 [Bondarzewia mesenterica]
MPDAAAARNCERLKLCRPQCLNEPEDYEQILASLALDIQKRQTRLSEIRLRERRSILLVTFWTLGLWGLYVSFWYTGLLPNFGVHRREGQSETYSNAQIKKAVKGLPVFLGPIVILFTRRIVQLYYTRIGDAEEKTLKALYKEQRSKVEDIKKKTNYYSTRNLIERYEDGPAVEPPLRQRSAFSHQDPQLPVTPQRSSAQSNHSTHQMPSLLQNQLAPTPHQLLTPPRKQWFDKLADALLGDDESSTNITASRYALICQKCFAHNGLVKENIPCSLLVFRKEYICMKCGHFNPSPRSLKEGSPSSQRSQSSSPTALHSRLVPPGQQPLTSAGRSASPSKGVSAAVTEDLGESVEGNSIYVDVDS